MSRFVKVSRVLAQLTCQKRHISWETFFWVFSTFPGSNHFSFFSPERSRSVADREKLFGSRSATINIEIQSRSHGKVAQTIPTLYQLYTTFPWPNHFFFCWKGLDLSLCVGNVFRLYLLQLIPIQSRFHQEVAKINLLCISFTQRFRGRITSIFFVGKLSTCTLNAHQNFGLYLLLLI